LQILFAVDCDYKVVSFELNFHISAANNGHQSRLTPFKQTPLARRD
jgi:hypothetical protein